MCIVAVLVGGKAKMASLLDLYYLGQMRCQGTMACCRLCQMRFNFVSCLMRHLRHQHLKHQGPHKCPCCDRAFEVRPPLVMNNGTVAPLLVVADVVAAAAVVVPYHLLLYIVYSSCFFFCCCCCCPFFCYCLVLCCCCSCPCCCCCCWHCCCP